MSIAYKEALETKFWLCLLKETAYREPVVFTSMYGDVDELAKMLFSTIRSSRSNPLKTIFLFSKSMFGNFIWQAC